MSFKHFFIIAAIAVFGLTAGCLQVYAQEVVPTPSAEEIIKAETVTAEDLDVKDTGLLPSSSFYFFKNWRRGIQKLFTFDPVKKAELELRFTDEKLAEVKKIAETHPEKTEVLTRAVENYHRSQDKLKDHFIALKETSQNPNLDKLLEKMADRTVKHEKLFAELKQKFEENKEVRTGIESATEAVENSLTEASKKERADKFIRRFEKALVETKGGDLKHLHSLEILDRLQDKAGAELKDKIITVRQEFSERLKEHLKDFAEKHKETASEVLKDAFERFSGDKAHQLGVMEELREAVHPRVKEAFRVTEEKLEKNFEEHKEDIKEQAEKVVARVKEQLTRLEEKTKSVSSLPADATVLLNQVKTHLERAVSALGEQKFGEAFGQARSVETMLRKIFLLLEEKKTPHDTDLREEFSEFEKWLSGWEVKVNEVLKEKQLDGAKKVLEETRMHLRLARESLEAKDPHGAKKHFQEARRFGRVIERLLESRGDHRDESPAIKPHGSEEMPKPITKPTPRPGGEEAVFCTQEYKPVCGEDGKTYGNACIARLAKVGVKHDGECGRSQSGIEIKPVPVVGETTPDKEVRLEIKPIEGIVKEPTPAATGEVSVSASAAQPPQSFVAVKEDGKFNPSSVTIKKGGKVTWQNSSGKEIWPASAFHPTHEVYPAFDALRGIKSGDSYTFLFDRVGAWKYHDHLNPSSFGTVEVVE